MEKPGHVTAKPPDTNFAIKISKTFLTSRAVQDALVSPGDRASRGLFEADGEERGIPGAGVSDCAFAEDVCEEVQGESVEHCDEGACSETGEAD